MDFSWFKSLFEKISISFHWSKKNSPTTNTKIGTNIEKQLIINQGISPEQFHQINESVLKIVDDRINIYRETFKLDAKLVFNERLKDFKEFLLNRTHSLSELDYERFKEPDMQLKIIEATNLSGRISDSNRRELLANLVIRRIKNENTKNQELTDIVYNEAISTIDKLTLNQLKTIALCFLLHYTKHNNITSLKEMDNYFNKYIGPFLDIKKSESEFQHIVYSGCGSISIGSWDIVNIFKANYDYLLVKPFTNKELEVIGLDSDLQKLFFTQYEKTDNYLLNIIPYINIVSKAIFENIFFQNINENIIKKIYQLVQSHLENNADVKKIIETSTILGKQIIETVEKTKLQNLTLTSVGTAIASTYYEQITSDKINIALWIN